MNTGNVSKLVIAFYVLIVKAKKLSKMAGQKMVSNSIFAKNVIKDL